MYVCVCAGLREERDRQREMSELMMKYMTRGDCVTNRSDENEIYICIVYVLVVRAYYSITSLPKRPELHLCVCVRVVTIYIPRSNQSKGVNGGNDDKGRPRTKCVCICVCV